MSTVTTEIRHEPDAPVYSRVSWSAILGGAFVAFALYFLLDLVGAAIGLSMLDNRDMEGFATGAGIWTILSIAVALFVGGYVTSCFTVGENHFEAFMYGAIVWGVSFALVLWLGATASLGFNALVGMSNHNVAMLATPAVGVVSPTMLEDLGRKAGLSPAEIERLKAAVPEPPARETVARATWWALAGTLLSMLAAVFGATSGAATAVYRRTWFPRVFMTPMSGPGHMATH
jgi:hypothetical protein